MVISLLTLIFSYNAYQIKKKKRKKINSSNKNEIVYTNRRICLEYWVEKYFSCVKKTFFKQVDKKKILPMIRVKMI